MKQQDSRVGLFLEPARDEKESGHSPPAEVVAPSPWTSSKSAVVSEKLLTSLSAGEAVGKAAAGEASVGAFGEVTGEAGKETSEEMGGKAGEGAGETVGKAAGEISGEAAGEASGEISVEAVGQTARGIAGEAVGEIAGEVVGCS